jgi:hypothetical protein
VEELKETEVWFPAWLEDAGAPVAPQPPSSAPVINMDMANAA